MSIKTKKRILFFCYIFQLFIITIFTQYSFATESPDDKAKDATKDTIKGTIKSTAKDTKKKNVDKTINSVQSKKESKALKNGDAKTKKEKVEKTAPLNSKKLINNKNSNKNSVKNKEANKSAKINNEKPKTKKNKAKDAISEKKAKKENPTAKKTASVDEKSKPKEEIFIKELEKPDKYAFPSKNDPEFSEEKKELREKYLYAREAFLKKDYKIARNTFEFLLPIYKPMRDYIIRDLAYIIVGINYDTKMNEEDANKVLDYSEELLSISSSQQHGWAYYFKGKAYFSLNQLDNAEKNYRLSLQYKQNIPKGVIYASLGKIYELQKKYGDAYVNNVLATQLLAGKVKSEIEESIKILAPNIPPEERIVEWVMKRDELASLLKKGADNDVLKLIQSAREQCKIPDVVNDLRRMEGYCYIKLSRKNEGLDILLDLMEDEVEGGKPNWETISYLQKWLGKKGDISTRKELLNNFIKSHPPSQGIEAFFIMASILKDEGKYKEAENLYEQVIERYPNLPESLEAYWLLAWSHIKKGDNTSAQKAILSLLAQPNLNNELLLKASYWNARLLENIGKKSDSSKIYEFIVKKNPDSYYSAMAYWRLESSMPNGYNNNINIRKLTNKEKELAVNPAQNAIFLLFPNFSEHIQYIESNTISTIIDRAKELWLLGLTSDALTELSYAVQHPDANPQALWIASALAHAMGSMVSGIKYGHIYLTMEKNNSEINKQYLAYPTPYMDAIYDYSSTHTIDPALTTSLIQQESTFRENIGSPVGAIGLMQVMPYTAKDIARWLNIKNLNIKDLYKADFNIRLGTKYLKYVLDRYEGNIIRTIASYNAGPNAVRSWSKRFGDLPDDYFVEEIPYKETRQYVRLVLRNLYGYKRVYQNNE